MVKVRRPGDPWHTVLYQDPHRLWWAPAVFMFVVLLAVQLIFFGDEGWASNLFYPAGFSGGYLLFAGIRHWSRQP